MLSVWLSQRISYEKVGRKLYGLKGENNFRERELLRLANGVTQQTMSYSHSNYGSSVVVYAYPCAGV